MSTILFKNVRKLDPKNQTDVLGDLFVKDGLIAALPESVPADCEVIDGAGKILTPGFIDVHVHLREPGGEAAETIETGTRACAKGGFTTVVSMPNTAPTTDTPELVQWTMDAAAKAGFCRVLPTAAFSSNRGGTEMSDLPALKAAGAVAFTDDGSTPDNTLLMEEIFRASEQLNMKILDHAQDPAAEKTGVMHEGIFSKKFNLPGIPWMAEYAMVQRDINLSKMTGCAVHIQHITSGKAGELVKQAKIMGVNISAEVTPHHLMFCDGDIDPTNSNFKMNPPLRSAEDRAKLIELVKLGTITVLATDHAPHLASKKALPFDIAPFGIIGAETAIGASYTALVKSEAIDLMKWVRCWTTGPAKVLELASPSLEEGAVADLTLIDIEKEWTVAESDIYSKSKNTPFYGKTLTAKAELTVLAGKIVCI